MRFLNKFLLLFLLFSVSTSVTAQPIEMEKFRKRYTEKARDAGQKEGEANKSEIKDFLNSAADRSAPPLSMYDMGLPDDIARLIVGSFIGPHADDYGEFIAPQLTPYMIPGIGGEYGITNGSGFPVGNQCIDRSYPFKPWLLWDPTKLRPSGEICYEQEFDFWEGCWEIKIYPYTEYRYPVTKVEGTSVPFRTRYLPKGLVKVYTNLIEANPMYISNSVLKQRQVLQKDITSSDKPLTDVFKAIQQPGAVPLPPQLSPDAGEIARKGVKGERLNLKAAPTAEEGFRSVEFHVVPELSSRTVYKEINDAQPVMIYYWEYEVCGASISRPELKHKRTKALCHERLLPTDTKNFNWEEHFYGSEFPEVKPAGKKTKIGAYEITRDKYSILTRSELRKYKDAFKELLKNPFACSVFNMNNKTAPKGSIPKKIEDNLPDVEHAGCLGGGLGSFLPFWNVAYTMYDTMVSQIAWRRGIELAFIFKRDFFHKYDKSLDLVQWISPDHKMGDECVEPEKPFWEFGSEAGADKYANGTLPTDFPNVAVHWKRFRCCLEGRVADFDPIRR